MIDNVPQSRERFSCRSQRWRKREVFVGACIHDAPVCIRLHGRPRAMAVVSSPLKARFVILVSGKYARECRFRVSNEPNGPDTFDSAIPRSSFARVTTWVELIWEGKGGGGGRAPAPRQVPRYESVSIERRIRNRKGE